VSFLGGAYGYRLEFINKLKAANIPIECFGAGWGGPERIAKDPLDVYCRSIINLGIGYTGAAESMTCIKGRDFEVPGLGSLYLTMYDPELARLYDIGKEILCYRDAIDCIELIRYYLENPEEAAEIAHAGRQRCMREHTWWNRMEGMLKWMGILEID
jgi:spore maturation protein CgeB